MLFRSALGNDVPGLSSARLTVLWYLVPVLGAASWISVGLTSPSSRWTRAVAAAAAVMTILAGAAFVRLTGLGDLGPGAMIALAGALALVVGSWWDIRGAGSYRTRSGASGEVVR